MQPSANYPTLSHEQVQLSAYLTAMAMRKEPGPSAPGECAAFQRIGTTHVLGLERSWQPGPDAIGVFHLMEQRGMTLPEGTDAEVGDLLVWIDGHGAHGHIAMRVIGNRVAENSSAHIGPHNDARGFRPLDTLDENYRVIRLWRK